MSTKTHKFSITSDGTGRGSKIDMDGVGLAQYATACDIHIGATDITSVSVNMHARAVIDVTAVLLLKTTGGNRAVMEAEAWMEQAMAESGFMGGWIATGNDPTIDLTKTGALARRFMEILVENATGE